MAHKWMHVIDWILLITLIIAVLYAQIQGHYSDTTVINEINCSMIQGHLPDYMIPNTTGWIN